MLLYFSLFMMVVSAALLVVYKMVSFPSSGENLEKYMAFECGFDPLSEMRAPFSTRFFVLVVLFLIFDIEIALLFPLLSKMMSSLAPGSMIASVTFIVILMLGLVHEWNEGAIDWMSE